MLRSLLQASVAASRRAVAWNLNDIAPPSEQVLFRFASVADLSPWKVYSDHEHGGLSKASLELNKESGQTGVFSGTLSVDMPDDTNIRMKRSGFTGMRTSHEDDCLDLEAFDTIAFRLKGDGRVYVSNIRTENWIGGLGASPSNTWQAFVFAPAGEWSVVKIPFNKYLPTWRGKIIDSNQDLNAARVTGMGLSVAADGGPEGAVQGPGKFRLELDWIKARRSK
ncbi:probable complex I intermediate-associated protein 30 [Physcomitrium patens]|uniref:NADH:ubiquinone oxidoreductase intermediate-associated protein 30 domain-containing protein n=1 Tax=Physcomitrium patens TaxID=3218 RepID=A9S4K8_PHYPA|nr:probable complex I intermediate-associated protein 30 [Physcomitrium patens]PNR57782.1 hypothetical protein PHYPA_004776 [Physcomitrium patens]|eukprot:XP_024370875.1 probable complex I intermediate-associated protein 30 [Physcomitrella patens]